MLIVTRTPIKFSDQKLQKLKYFREHNVPTFWTILSAGGSQTTTAEPAHIPSCETPYIQSVYPRRVTAVEKQSNTVNKPPDIYGNMPCKKTKNKL